jgi:hydrogenase nickel incorporation protein HypA/HybF
MHEMTLCVGVVRLAEDAARCEKFARVLSIVLEVGELGQVAPEAMLFCFQAVSRGTIAEGAQLLIERVPGAGWCLACERTVSLSERFGACPRCGRHQVQMTAGDELRVREMEVA